MVGSVDNTMALLFVLSGTFIIPACGDKGEGEPTTEDICKDYVGKYIECNPSYAMQQGIFEAYCEYQVAYYTNAEGVACGEAMEDFFACVSQLTCAQIVAENFGDCAAQEMAFEDACDFGIVDEVESDTGSTFTSGDPDGGMPDTSTTG